MATTNLPVQLGTVPDNFCFQGFNSPSWQQMVGLMFVQLPNFTGLIISQTAPGPENFSYGWLKIDSNGDPIRLYKHSGAGWISRHPVAPGFISWYDAASLNTIAALDESGSANISDVPTLYSGPFWEPIHYQEGVITHSEYLGRVPVVPGDIPLAAGDLGLAITVASGQANLGEGRHKLTSPEIPAHRHDLPDVASPDASILSVTGGNDYFGATVALKTGYTGGDGYHNTVQPVLGLWPIRRSSRVYYVEP